MRDKLDRYYTPTKCVETLLDDSKINCAINCVSTKIFEPCVGGGAIANMLHVRFPNHPICTNDIDRSVPAHSHLDATKTDLWESQNIGWTVSNPPFNCAIDIVENAHKYSKKGVIMLLRLSFLEPVKRRITFLNLCPPTKIIVTQNGGTDSVTTA